jgi:DNA-directed RNA polymerase specialized sigma24 family protein
MGRELLDQLAMPSDDTAARTAILAAAKAWKDFGPREPAQVRAFLLATVRRVTVEETAVQMTLSRSGLRTVLVRGTDIPSTRLTPARGQEDQDDLLQVSISVRLTRCGGGMRLIVPGESGGERQARPNVALIKAVARAYTWHERLLSGEKTSLQAIAQEHGVMPRYVRRILRCAFLAPDLVEAILQGRQPPELTLFQLCALPFDWSEQRKEFGPV